MNHKRLSLAGVTIAASILTGCAGEPAEHDLSITVREDYGATSHYANMDDVVCEPSLGANPFQIVVKDSEGTTIATAATPKQGTYSTSLGMCEMTVSVTVPEGSFYEVEASAAAWSGDFRNGPEASGSKTVKSDGTTQRVVVEVG